MAVGNQGGAMNKLPFHIVYCSGEDESFPIVELMHHSMSTKGWQSPKFAEFPLEIIIAFDGEANIQQIEFLSHESKIASRIEVFIIEPTDESRKTLQFFPYEKAQWTRLGYLSLSSNEHTEFLARELKTVHVNCTALYLRLLLHKCHVNHYNFYNQVGLMGLSVGGTMEQHYKKQPPTQYDLIFQSMLPYDTEEVSLKDMKPPVVNVGEVDDPRAQFDPITMKKLREITIMKQKAVQMEDYDTAKKLKEQIDGLKLVGAKLLHLENQKKIAVQKEDYAEAKNLKMEIEQLRKRALGVGHQATPLPAAQPPSHLPPMHPAEPPQPYPTHVQTPPQEAPPEYPTAMPAIPQAAAPAPPQAPLPHPPPGPPPQHVPQDAVDNRPAASRALLQRIPNEELDESTDAPKFAARNIDDILNDPDPFNTASTKVMSNMSHSSPAANGEASAFDISKQPEWEQDLYNRIRREHSESASVDPISDAKLRENTELYTAFGEHTLRCLLSKKWNNRDAAIRGITSKFMNEEPHPFPSDSGRLLAVFLKFLTSKGSGLNDTVAAVFSTTIDVLRQIVESPLVVSAVHSLQPLIATLVQKAGDSNQRLREQATEFLMFLALCPEVGAERVAVEVLTDHSDKKKGGQQWRPLLARVLLTNLLLEKMGLSRKDLRTGLTVDGVMTKVALPAVNNANGEVREAGVKTCGILHRLTGGKGLVEKHIQSLKPALKASIEKEMSTAEGGGEQRLGVHEREMMNSSMSIDGDDEMKRQIRAARAAAQAPQPKPSAAPPKQQPPQSAPPPPAAVPAEDDTICQFCGKQDPRFNTQVLDLHYLHSCQMLYQCKQCSQVVEIMLLHEHWLTECTNKANMRECPRCREAIHIDEYEVHHAKQNCFLVGDKYSICPLCKATIGSSDEGWEKHLLGEGCPNNPRVDKGADAVEFTLHQQMRQQQPGSSS